MTRTPYSFLLDPDNLHNLDPGFLKTLLSEEDQEVLKLSTEQFIVYMPEGDEYSYYTQLPGIKLLATEGLDFQRAKSIADKLTADIKEQTGKDVVLVVVDNERLKQMSEEQQ